MAMADATRQSNALPSLSYIDLEKIKRENSLYNTRVPSSAVHNMPAPPLASPTSMYSGPPPPYSYPSSTASSVVGGHTNGYISSPTEPRKPPNDDKDQHHTGRQSLPSIHEALNRDQPLSISSLLTQTNAPPPSSHQSHHSSNQSPTSPVDRTYKDIPPSGVSVTSSRSQPSPTYAQSLPRQHHSPRPTLEMNNGRLPSTTMRESHFPPMLPPTTTASSASVSRPSLTSTNLRRASPPYDAGPRPAPVINQPSSYASYSAPYSYPPPTPTIASGYQPPSPAHPANWRYGESDIERTEDYRRNPMKESSIKPSFGEAVKRHLDNFELETSLNEIAEGSGRALDFSKHYGSRAHQTQRSGPIPGSMPTLAECDELMGYQKRVLDSMQRVKEVIHAQQQALAEQRSYENSYKPSAEPDDDGSSYHEKLEGGGGFAGAEAKKRRGRAAPPGRCHSCNRAETPEWRRGPDGARTLCNACGLHYAKLTRKMGSKSSNAGSNLRPKEMSQGSP